MEDATILNIGGINYRIVDASVPSWAKQNTKPSYAANEISGLAAVATSGSYNDLTDKPNIPTVLTVPVNSTGSGGNIVYILGNGIQYANITTVLDNGGEVVLKYGDKIYCLSKRGNDSLTFSSLQGDDDNYSSFDIDSASRVGYHSGTIITSETALSKGTPTGNGNAVTDIDVNGHQITLTKGTTFLTASDISGKAGKSEAIGSLSLSLDTTNYKITLTGTYVDGTPFTISDVIDLPLESVVINGSYNSSTKKVILTLKNNSTIEFSIADLISGLQSEITSSNKLSADLVKDGTNNKVFTATEKTKLSGIEAGAEVNVQSDWNQTNTSADDYVKNKPTIPNVGTLNTNNSTAQTVSSSESFSGSINLHKISKTGSYNDLNDKPIIPTVPTLKTLDGVSLTGSGDISKVVFGKLDNGNFYPGEKTSSGISSNTWTFSRTAVTPELRAIYIEVLTGVVYYYDGYSFLNIRPEKLDVFIEKDSSNVAGGGYTADHTFEEIYGVISRGGIVTINGMCNLTYWDPGWYEGNYDTIMACESCNFTGIDYLASDTEEPYIIAWDITPQDVIHRRIMDFEDKQSNIQIIDLT
jgi:hypothetical protein